MKIKIIILSFFIFFSLLVLNIKSPADFQIISTPTLEPVEAALKDADKNTLVIFDVDDVLLMPTDEIYLVDRGEYFTKIMDDLKKHFTKTKFEKMINAIMIGRPVKIVDFKIIPLIKSLQTKEVPVMALTALSTGRFNNKQSFVEWRIEQLKNADIIFNQWAAVKPKKFTDFAIKNPPEFKEGVLFSSGIPKGEILKTFLQDCYSKPKRIVFLDDRRNNLESVEAFCKAEGISFLGFEYTAVKETRPVNFNHKRAELQIKMLKNKLQWLSDQAADQMLGIGVKERKSRTSEACLEL